MYYWRILLVEKGCCMIQTTSTSAPQVTVLPPSHAQPARGNFAALVATYSLSVMNDQFFKQTAMLLVLQLAMSSAWQGYIQLTFMLSFVLLAAPVGWLADRFPKRRVVIGSRLLECIAAVVGAFGLYRGDWAIILLAIGLMGLRGAIFSPSINGSIPEIIPDAQVTKANGILKVFTTISMLAGIATAGFVLDIPGRLGNGMPMWQAVVAAGIVGVSLLGILISLGLSRRAAASPSAPFPLLGPVQTVTSLYQLRKDRLLSTVIFSDAYFWFLGALLVQLINALGMTQLQYSATRTSYLVVAEVVGVAIGGVLAGYLASGQRWHRVLAPAGVGMGLFLAAIAVVPLLPVQYHLVAMLVSFAIAGTAGGLFLIPQESFIQVRPSPQEKGRVISSANFASFIGMLLAGPVSIFLNQKFQPSVSIAMAGGATLLVAIWLWLALPRGDAHA